MDGAWPQRTPGLEGSQVHKRLRTMAEVLTQSGNDYNENRKESTQLCFGRGWARKGKTSGSKINELFSQIPRGKVLQSMGNSM